MIILMIILRVLVSHIHFFLCSVPFATGHLRKRVRYKSMHGNTRAFGHMPAISVTPSLVKKVEEIKNYMLNVSELIIQ